MFVHQRMTTSPFTVSSTDTVPAALEVMQSRGVRHLPVVDAGRVVGVITNSDIASASPSKATTFSAGELNYLLAKLKVSQVMSREPITIFPDALLEEAAVLMRDRKVEMLPVVDANRLVGVITESTILDAFIELLGFRDSGTRLTIEADDVPGALATLSGIMAHHEANISHIAAYRGGLGRSAVVVGINSLNTDAIEAELAEAGFRVIARLTHTG